MQLVITKRFSRRNPPGGTVHLVCRNKERAEVAKEEIVTETGNQVSCFLVFCLLLERLFILKTLKALKYSCDILLLCF